MGAIAYAEIEKTRHPNADRENGRADEPLSAETNFKRVRETISTGGNSPLSLSLGIGSGSQAGNREAFKSAAVCGGGVFSARHI